MEEVAKGTPPPPLYSYQKKAEDFQRDKDEAAQVGTQQTSESSEAMDPQSRPAVPEHATKSQPSDFADEASAFFPESRDMSKYEDAMEKMEEGK
ncbi:hypothetical protein HDU96_011154 [Phlyctochytrium bullatum]|nr:hypothetical protein HDU96_011154 [Phlyctochytrium bullatum]